ncbi:MAG: class I SAM-dependent methyltransferase [Chromatiaceae bacterium]|nr:class I SAM-dependent methyltransferase [Chromatiaceae bacterium]
MKRRPEPELMEGEAQALAYAEADFSASNSLFMELLAQLNPGPLDGARALDIGCGPADIPRRFLSAYPRAHCDALDGSRAMLDRAEAMLAGRPGLAARCRLLHECIPSAQLPAQHYDLILSNSLLHHLHEPQVLWRTILDCARPGALVLVMDLTRPASAGWVEALVETYAANEPEVLRADFRHSLFAAFEPREVVAQLAEAGLDGLEVGVVSDRHLAVWGRLPA